MTTDQVRPARWLAAAPLRFWLMADAAITGLCAVAYLAAAPLVVDLMGSEVGSTRAIGGFLLGFAVVVALVAARSSTASWAVAAIVTVNAAWVAASLTVVLTGALGLTVLGVIWTIAQALVVAVLATQQFRTRATS